MQTLHRMMRGAEEARMRSFFQSFEAPLRSFLTRQTRSIHDAEDLAQEVFLRLWRMDTRGEIRHLRALVFTTANNLLRDRSRRTYTRMMRQSVPATEVELSDYAADPSGLVESFETLSTFGTVLSRLRPSTRAAFLLYRFEARTQAQIAEQMDISVSMVEKHLGYVMTALRDAGIDVHSR